MFLGLKWGTSPVKAAGAASFIGFVFAIIPHPDRTFDKGRPPTTLADIQARGPWPDPPQGHVNVFRPETIAAFYEAAGGPAILEIQEPDDKCGNGFTVVAIVTG